MAFDSDQAVVDKVFQLLEPQAESTAEGFRQCRHKLVKFFAWRYCDDPENLADETVTRLLKNVRAGQEISADNPYSYLYAIGTNVFKEYLRAKKKWGAVVDLEILRETPVLLTVDDCQKQCLEQLPQAKQELLAHYYLDDDDREDIAREQKMTINALRLQIHRTKDWLKRCCEDCRKQLDGPRN